MFERLFRDLGADTPLRSFADGRLRGYFADFKAYRVLSERKARQALAEVASHEPGDLKLRA